MKIPTQKGKEWIKNEEQLFKYSSRDLYVMIMVS